MSGIGARVSGSAGARRLRVLAADDDPTFLGFVKDALGRSGDSDVTVVSDGMQALARALSEHPPDVLILDWLMPKMNGTQVCRTIRARRLGVQPYIILATARGRRAELLECMSAGADDLVQKPIAPDLFASRVEFARLRLPAPDAGKALRRELQAALSEGNGELAIRSGNTTARVLIHEGRVAWAHVADGAPGLLEVLAPGTGLDAETARAVIAECRKTGATLSATLSSWGLVERAHLRESIQSWLGRKLETIGRFADPKFLFLPARQAYAEDMLFDLDELWDVAPPSSASSRRPPGERSPSLIPRADWSEAFASTEGAVEAVTKLLSATERLDGALGSAVLNRRSGACLGRRGHDLDPDVAWAHLHCLNAVARDEGLAESIVVTERHYHLARPILGHPDLFLYVVVDANYCVLANARLDVQAIVGRASEQ